MSACRSTRDIESLRRKRENTFEQERYESETAAGLSFVYRYVHIIYHTERTSTYIQYRRM
jgi:hypothetical protein